MALQHSQNARSPRCEEGTRDGGVGAGRGGPHSRPEPEFSVPHITRETSGARLGGLGSAVDHSVPQVSCHLPQSSTKFPLTMAESKAMMDCVELVGFIMIKEMAGRWRRGIARQTEAVWQRVFWRRVSVPEEA